MPRARILAVDDQRYFRELIRRVCSSRRATRSRPASGGEEALRLLEHADFDVIVTDLVMPGMTGIDLVQRVKERDPEQDVVVITASVDVQTRRRRDEARRDRLPAQAVRPRHARRARSRASSSAARLREERDRLLAENIEFLGARSLFERALALFSTLSLESLSDRMVEGLCRETRRAGRRALGRARRRARALNLAGVRGLVRLDEEPEELALASLPGELRRSPSRSATRSSPPRAARRRSDDKDAAERRGAALWSRCAAARSCSALVRLTDKLDGEASTTCDRASAEKFAVFAAPALATPQRFRARAPLVPDPDTDDLHASSTSTTSSTTRSARRRASAARFSLVRLELDGLADLRARVSRVRSSSSGTSRSRSTSAARSAPPTCSRSSPRPLLRAARRRPTRSAPPCSSAASARRSSAPSRWRDLASPIAPSCCSAPPRSRPTARSSRRSGACSRAASTRTAGACVRERSSSTRCRSAASSTRSSPRGSSASPRPASR